MARLQERTFDQILIMKRCLLPRSYSFAWESDNVVGNSRLAVFGRQHCFDQQIECLPEFSGSFIVAIDKIVSTFDQSPGSGEVRLHRCSSSKPPPAVA